MELGPVAYAEAVKQYYEAIGAEGADRAQRTYARWVVRQIEHTFETHIRGYWRQEVSRRGGIFHAASDEVQLPQSLWESGRLVADLRWIIQRYQVRGDLRETAERLLLAKLRHKWGLR